MSVINKVLISISIALNINSCFGITRIYFSKCASGGFSCSVTKGKYSNLTYQCPSGVDDVLIMINQFNSPSNAESLLIQNCRRLSISVRCSSDRKMIQFLHIRNIGSLSIQRLPFQSQLPQDVLLENIRYIESIPSFTFTQVDRSLLTTGCVTPKNDFRTIQLKNLKIDTVQSNGFFMQNGYGNITFENVTINRLQTSAVAARLGKSGAFFMERSTVEVAEHLAFQLVTGRATFTQSSFVEISSGGINGTIGSLIFTNNSVNNLQPRAISVFSGEVRISHNRFEYLKSGSLEAISPGLLENSAVNFRTLNFVYEFRGNAINFMDAGCLHPDMMAYENVASDTVFEENTVLCSCENSVKSNHAINNEHWKNPQKLLIGSTTAWLLSTIGHGYNTPLLSNFYESFLDPANKNTCWSSCYLPISSTINMINMGQCMENVTIDELCEMENKSTLAISLSELEGSEMFSTMPQKSSGRISSFVRAKGLLFTGIFVLLIFIIFL